MGLQLAEDSFRGYRDLIRKFTIFGPEADAVSEKHCIAAAYQPFPYAN
jgi:hypothetical protein